MVLLSSETDFVSNNEAFKKLAYDIAMHVAAASPEFLSKEDISAEARTLAREAMQKEVEGKPKEMQEKILDGKLESYFKERVLLQQPFVKNPDQTVGDLVKEHNAKLGENIVVRRFSRMVLGELA